MNWVDYREQLGIGFNDEQKFIMLRNKITNFLPSIGDYYSSKSYKQYIDMVGEESFLKYTDAISGIERSFASCENTEELISKYVALFNTYCEDPIFTTYGYRDPSNVKILLRKFLQKSLGELKIPYELYSDKDGYYVFPKGVKAFDDALVSEVLDWLQYYPLTEKAWSKALREYSEVNQQKASGVADKMRKALETFFKEFFENEKTLENNKAAYGNYLKSKGIPAELSNNLETLLHAYTNFMNGYAKHSDRTEAIALEYLLYQTGNIMRLLITLKKNETI